VNALASSPTRSNESPAPETRVGRRARPGVPDSDPHPNGPDPKDHRTPFARLGKGGRPSNPDASGSVVVAGPRQQKYRPHAWGPSGSQRLYPVVLRPHGSDVAVGPSDRLGRNRSHIGSPNEGTGRLVGGVSFSSSIRAFALSMRSWPRSSNSCNSDLTPGDGGCPSKTSCTRLIVPLVVTMKSTRSARCSAICRSTSPSSTVPSIGERFGISGLEAQGRLTNMAGGHVPTGRRQPVA